MKKILRTLTLVSLYLALATPLLYWKEMLFPFITPRVYYFAAIITVGWNAYAWLIAFDPQYRPHKSRLFWLVSLFFASMLVSAVFGIDINSSFFGNYERMTGLIYVLYFYLYFVMLTGMLRTEKDWKRYISALLFAACIMGGLAIYQYTGLLGDFFLLTKAWGKAWSLTGNYIYLSTFGLFSAFYCLYLFLKYKYEAKWAYCTILALSGAMLLLAGTRAGVASFFIGLLIYLVVSKKFKLLIVLLCLVITLYALPRPIARYIPQLTNIQSIQYAGTLEQRVTTWKIGLKAAKERPVFGWGHGNFRIAHDKYMTADVYVKGGFYEQNKDSAHNIYIDALVERGIVGLLVLLALLSYVLYTSFKANKLLFAFVLAVAINSAFIFFDISSFLLLMMLFTLVDHENNTHLKANTL